MTNTKTASQPRTWVTPGARVAIYIQAHQHILNVDIVHYHVIDHVGERDVVLDSGAHYYFPNAASNWPIARMSFPGCSWLRGTILLPTDDPRVIQAEVDAKARANNA